MGLLDGPQLCRMDGHEEMTRKNILLGVVMGCLGGFAGIKRGRTFHKSASFLRGRQRTGKDAKRYPKNRLRVSLGRAALSV